MQIRTEEATDRAAVEQINCSAFGRRDEADLVAALREEAAPVISLVAEMETAVVGHIMFSPVSLEGSQETPLMGLGPMAVEPGQQRSGIGSALVDAGLEACKRQNVDAVVVLGHPDYYPRFGFTLAARRGLRCEYEVPEEAFMALELRNGSLADGGLVRYHPVFSHFG